MKINWRKANAVLMVFWIGMCPVSYLTGWLDSKVYISALSLYAIIISHNAAWRADVPIDEDDNG